MYEGALLLLLIYFVLYLIYKPNLDEDEEGRILLWYNSKGKRKYIRII